MSIAYTIGQKLSNPKKTKKIFTIMLARLLLAILKHNPLRSKGLRMSNGRRGGREPLDVKDFFHNSAKKSPPEGGLLTILAYEQACLYIALNNIVHCSRSKITLVGLENR